MNKEATEVLSDSTKKIQAFLPKTDSSDEGIELQDINPSSPIVKRGGRLINSNAILRRIEKSKRVFHKTNKDTRRKSRKTQRRRINYKSRP